MHYVDRKVIRNQKGKPKYMVTNSNSLRGIFRVPESAGQLGENIFSVQDVHDNINDEMREGF